MVNDYGTKTSFTLKSRFKQLWKPKTENIFILFFFFVWAILFTIPLFVESVAEFISLSVLSFVGYSCGFLFSKIPLIAFIWIIDGGIYGLIYKFISIIFYLIFCIFTFPGFLMQR